MDSTAERYFHFLGTAYQTREGETRQPAKGNFIKLLRATHQAYRPRFDLSACVSGRAADFGGKVWFWSDLHLSHANIIRYCDRPFADTAGMNAALVANCLARVTAQDIVVFGGDLTISDVAATNAFLRAIPAHTILVLGNHDAKKTQVMLPLEVDEVAACLELEYGDRSVFVSHYPMQEALLQPGQVNLHGHIHNTALPAALGSGARHVNMSVELIGFAPRTLDELLPAQV